MWDSQLSRATAWGKSFSLTLCPSWMSPHPEWLHLILKESETKTHRKPGTWSPPSRESGIYLRTQLTSARENHFGIFMRLPSIPCKQTVVLSTDGDSVPWSRRGPCKVSSPGVTEWWRMSWISLWMCVFDSYSVLFYFYFLWPNF